MMQSPPWLIRLSNWGAVVAVVGALFLGVQMTRRLLSRVVVTPLPSLAQLADSARGAVAGSGTGGARRPATIPDDSTDHPIVIGATLRSDSLVRAARRALWRGRWGEAASAFERLARDWARERANAMEGANAIERANAIEGTNAIEAANASATLALSLLAAWRADEPAARTALARAVRLRARLSAPERSLLDAHQRWMRGDIRGSDSVYRVLLTDVRDDPTIWYAAAFVHRHDGGAIDSMLVAPGSPVGRRLHDQPTRRVSHVGAIPALWQVLALSPFHEAARLELARFASLYDDRAMMSRLTWGAELYDVEPATRLAMRVLDADARRDSTGWKLVLQLAASSSDPTALFAASRALATSGGILRPLSLWHAAELLKPLTDTSRNGADIAAVAHAWRGEYFFAVRREEQSSAELKDAAAIDPSVALPLLAWMQWLSRETPDSALRDTRARLEAWHPAEADSLAQRTWVHPHRGMEPQLRAYGIGLVSAALGDTARVLAEASALDALSLVPGDSALRGQLAGALRAEVAIARGDYAAAIAETNGVQQHLPPLWRDLSPFAGRVHARYRRGFAEQRAWQNVQARAAFVAFFSPTVPELPVYRSARQRFDATP